MLTNNEVKSLIIALGTNIGEQFDVKGLRYNKIVIMTDADVDGAHIRTLLLTLFYRYFPEIIRTGHLYIAMPPLYKVSFGKNSEYAYNDNELEKIKDKFIKEAGNKKGKENTGASPADTRPSQTEGEASPPRPSEEAEDEKTQTGPRLDIQRYKGLGEMNPQQLWETTMDPDTRQMKIVNIEDAQLADETFEILMGSNVEPRKNFIHTHAKTVKNLDI